MESALRSAGFDFQDRRTLPVYTLPVALYFPPKSQGKSSLLLGLGIGAGGLEKHEDVAGSIGSSYRLGEGTIMGAGGRGRSSAMS